MDLLLAEDLMLLLLDDQTGAVRQTHLRPLLGGAVLADLALAGAVEVEEKRGVWHTAKVHPVDGARPSDALLAAAYDEVAAKPRSAQDLVNRIGKPLKDDVTERLVERGLVRREEHRVLGIFPTTRWPAEDVAHEQGVRR
ncbi:MAG: GPP34 family phosphoprotein, partial [Actinomycetota bacterium]|nr:GPP34 family phosphoprotein [Actinomycetota bacterium]